MMQRRIGINGFGRIGRLAARIILDSTDFNLTAINSLSDPESHAYLLKHDSVYGDFAKTVTAEENYLKVNHHKITCYSEKDPENIPWPEAQVELVLECSGKFKTTLDAGKHLRKSVKQVIISSPAKDKTSTFVYGVNHVSFDPKKDRVISNSSCTTNCLALVIKVLDENFQVLRGQMTTIHAVTDSQNLLDNSHKKDPRLRRSALVNIIPSSSGSARDLTKLFPKLLNKLPCRSVRVPVPSVSLIDLVVEIKKATTSEIINQAFKKASQSELKNILGVASEPLVSQDYIGSPYSAIIDPFITDVTDKTLVHTVVWYDNEWGYANRLADLARYVSQKIL